MQKRVRLARRRRAVGLSQQELANQIGVDRTTVVRWERGETRPHPWHRPRLAHAIEVSLDDLSAMLAETPPRTASGEPPSTVAAITGIQVALALPSPDQFRRVELIDARSRATLLSLAPEEAASLGVLLIAAASSIKPPGELVAEHGGATPRSANTPNADAVRPTRIPFAMPGQR